MASLQYFHPTGGVAEMNADGSEIKFIRFKSTLPTDRPVLANVVSR